MRTLAPMLVSRCRSNFSVVVDRRTGATGGRETVFFALLLLASHPGHAKAHRSEMWEDWKNEQ
jgi:hypothetical protein